MITQKKAGAIVLWLALLFGLVGVLPTMAADLNGGCCADLEERIAELEASTARKGNRKVSLTISGWVAEQIVHWNDGERSNTYITSLGSTFASNINITGQAQITTDLTAGYVLHIEGIDSDVWTTNANRPDGPGPAGSPNSTNVLYSYWYMKSNTFGQVSIGKETQAHRNVIVSLDTSGTLVAAYWLGYDVFSFDVRGNFPTGTSMIWGNASSCRGWGGGPGNCTGPPRNTVRYDTPTIAGFSASASWGPDEEWGVQGRYSGSFGNVNFAAAASYGETNDSRMGAPAGGKLEYTQAAIYLQHMPSGIFATAGYGHLDQSVNPMDNPATDTWYFKSGVRLKLTPIGATIPYGEYLGANNSTLIIDSLTDTSRVLKDSSTTWWGLGVVQEIDAAAMSVWLRYRDHTVDVPGVDTKDMTTIVAGALINF
jgi:predicted porin